MKKWLIITLALVVVQLGAADICKETLDMGKNCTMLTSTLSCTAYNYTIINETGSIIEQDNLTLLNSSIYYFNFNETEGGYIIELCDSSTREITVEVNEMNNIAIILTLAGFGIFFIGAGIHLFTRHKEHD